MPKKLFANPDIPPFKNHLSEVLLQHPLTFSSNNGDMKTYAIVDKAQKFFWHAPYIDDEGIGLYMGDDKEIYEEVEPRLIVLDPFDHDIGDWLLDYGYGNNIGCFVMSYAGIETLAQHFQEFSKMILPDKYDANGDPQQAFVRFYDPRVLPDYIQNNSDATLLDFFEPISFILCENHKNVGELLFYHLDEENKLKQGSVILQQDEDETN